MEIQRTNIHSLDLHDVFCMHERTDDVGDIKLKGCIHLRHLLTRRGVIFFFCLLRFAPKIEDQNAFGVIREQICLNYTLFVLGYCILYSMRYSAAASELSQVR